MDNETHNIDGPEPAPADHPLRTEFSQLVQHAFRDTLGIPDKEICAYLSNMLADFIHEDSIYRVRDRMGLRVKDVAAMLMESDVALGATSFDQEREVHKHIGDFTLFFAGVYPEALRTLRAHGRADHLIDYVRQGKQSYYIVSTFTHGVYGQHARLFKELSQEFELCAYGLNLVRREWERSALNSAW